MRLCQGGMIIAVVALLKEKAQPTDAPIDGAIAKSADAAPTSRRVGDPRRRQGLNRGMP